LNFRPRRGNLGLIRKRGKGKKIDGTHCLLLVGKQRGEGERRISLPQRKKQGSGEKRGA